MRVWEGMCAAAEISRNCDISMLWAGSFPLVVITSFLKVFLIFHAAFTCRLFAGRD